MLTKSMVVAVGCSVLAFGCVGSKDEDGTHEVVDNLVQAGGHIDPAVQSLASERGITTSEAAKRIGWQEAAPDLAADLAKQLGPDRFGGMWIGESDDRIKVGVVGASGDLTSAINAVTSAHALGAAADTVEVSHSLAQLTTANSWLAAQLVKVNLKAPWPLQAGYTTVENTVRLGLPASTSLLTEAQRAVVGEAKLRYGSMLTTYTVTELAQADSCSFPYCDPPLRAGVKYDPIGCTLGFLGRGRSDGVLYAFTAGHCLVNTGGMTHTSNFLDGFARTLGPTQNVVLGASGDAAAIRITDEATWSARAWVFVLASTGQDGVSGSVFDDDYQIFSDNWSVLNMRICKSGVGSGTSCGRVRELGVTISYSGTTVTDLGRASYCRAGGDSGGPVFANNSAYGIHVAGSASCTAYYQGIRNAEDLLSINVAHD